MSDNKAFLYGFTAGAATAAGIAIAYDRILRKRVGVFANPFTGYQNTRVEEPDQKELAEEAAKNPVKHALRRAVSISPTLEATTFGKRRKSREADDLLPIPAGPQRTLLSTKAAAKKLEDQQKAANPETLSLPDAVLAKHPGTFGVRLTWLKDVKVDTVGLLPVPHLGKFYAAENAKNELGNGVTHDYSQFTGKEDVILGDIVRKEGMDNFSRGYLRAGPRKSLYFNPKQVKAAIVTCGGLCPGLNNIIREVTKALLNLYGVPAVYGVRGGYWGFHESPVGEPPLKLTHEAITGIQHIGGTVLGSARGGFDIEQIFGFCQRYEINQLYVVGGDGTHRAANKVGLEALHRKLNLAVAGIPKTIDNDLDLVDRTFGFNSAVMAAQDAIRSAAVEARCNKPNGIGIVKLMGRHAGFIAAHATLASGEVDLCLVPEVAIELEGPYGIMPHIQRVLKAKGKAVIVVAEGAGEELVGASAEVDAGGNKKLPEIGPFIKKAVEEWFKARNTTVTIKYIDPSYMIRSVPAIATDALFCMLLAQNAVHGAMAGYTCFTTGLCCNRTVYLPIPALVENSPRKMDKAGRTWERIIASTGQPNRPVDKSKLVHDSAVQPATVF